MEEISVKNIWGRESNKQQIEMNANQIKCKQIAIKLIKIY